MQRIGDNAELLSCEGVVTDQLRKCLQKSYVGRFSPRKSLHFCQNIQNLSGIHHKTIVRLDWSGTERLLLSFLCVRCQHVSLTVM